MDWREVSEIVFGAVLEGKVKRERLRPEMFFPPYGDGLECIYDKNTLIKKIGIDAFQTATHATHSLNGAGASGIQIKCNHCGNYNEAYESCSSCNSPAQEIDWVRMLEDAYANESAAEMLFKQYKKLKSNQEIDWSKLIEIINNHNDKQGDRFTPMGEIKRKEAKWKKSGVAWLDSHIGGLPRVGVVNIAGRPKVGKTSMILGLAGGYVRENPEENVAIFTLEMTGDDLKDRMNEVCSLTDEELSRILVNDEMVSPPEAISLSAGLENVGLIIMDFADLMIGGEINEQSMSTLYRTIGRGAKQLETCVALVSQLSRAYQGGIPRPFHVRYTGMAEALVVLNIMLYVPQNDYFELKDQDLLPVYDGHGWVIKWFSRFKTRQHAGEPGAVLVPFDGATGWDMKDTGRWFSLEKD